MLQTKVHNKSLRLFFSLLAVISVLFIETELPQTRVAAQFEASRNKTEIILIPTQSQQAVLERNETHGYKVYLEKDQFIAFQIEKSGGELNAQLSQPTGENYLSINCRSNETTSIFVIAEQSGFYQLDLTTSDKISLPSKYNLISINPRNFNQRDQNLIDSQKVFEQAENLRQKWTKGDTKEAILLYKKALELLKLNDEYGQSLFICQTLGDIYSGQGEFQEAILFYEQELSLSRKRQDLKNESLSLGNIGAILTLSGKRTDALETCQQAVNIARLSGDQKALAFALDQLGEVYSFSGNLEKALAYHQEAQPIWQELQNQSGIADNFLYLGFTYTQLNQVSNTFDSYNKALALWEELKDIKKIAFSYVVIGHQNTKIGELQKAFIYFLKAKVLYQNSPERSELGSLLEGIGSIYEKLGNFEQALEFRKEALEINRSTGFTIGEAALLWKVADSYESLDSLQTAFDYNQEALKIAQNLNDKTFEAVILRSLGRIQEKWGNSQIANQNFKSALDINQKLKLKRETAYCLNNIGHLAETENDFRTATKNYAQALKYNRENSDLFGEATTLVNLARLEQKQNNFAQAKLTLESALVRIESLREKVANQDLRSSYLASTHQVFEMYVELLMQMHKADPTKGYDVLAWQAGERARARNLFESLAESKKASSNEIDAKLVEQEQVLYKTLGEKEGERLKLMNRQSDETAIKSVSDEIDRVTADLEELRAKMRGDGGSKVETNTVSLPELQENLSDDALLLEYSLGDKQSYLWAITRNSLKAFDLPARSEIESSAKIVRESLTVRELLNGKAFAEQKELLQSAEQKFLDESGKLSGYLFGSLAGDLTNQKLLIIADGVLQYVPFEALPTPNSDNKIAVLANHEIVYQPSAATLVALEKRVLTRQPASNDIAVVADPVFSNINFLAKNDSPATRSFELNQGENPTNQELAMTLRDADMFDGKNNVPPLPASRVEAESILDTVSTGKNLSAIGFQATKLLATSHRLDQYRIVHFATHGVLNSRNPGQSGLILSLFDENGSPQDGFLRLSDIYALNLSSDLVVLSACSTGLGKDIRGEGLVGLTRGFLAAGATRTLSSLWKVDDEATAELMKSFYQNMLQKHLPPSAALREAKLSMSQQTRWQSPYFWAGFILQGEFRQPIIITEQTSTFNWSFTAYGIMLISVLCGVFIILRKRAKQS